MECHLKTHYKMEHKCRICQTVKGSQLELEMHTREHRLGNHYRCEQCGYLSKTANKLIEHVRVHTGERPFHCDRCSYSCKRKDNLNLHKKLKHAPRQTFHCAECPFATTHPFVFSRHVKKHHGVDANPEGDPVRDGPPLGMAASHALQSVALCITGKQQPGALSPCYLSANGSSSSAFSSRYEKYRNFDLAHLVPLTTLFASGQLGRRDAFVCPSPVFSKQRPPSFCSPPSSPLSPASLKHSFLAYLGLTERAKTV